MEMLNRKSKITMGFTYAILSAIFWGSYGAFISLLQNYGFNALSVALLAPTITLTWFFFRLLFFNRKAFKVDAKGLMLFFWLGGVLLNGTNYFYALGVQTTPLAIASIIMFCNVFIVMVISTFLFKYKITKVKMLSAAMTLIGLSLVLDVFSAGGRLDPAGLGWMCLVAFCTALAYVSNKYVLEGGYDYESNLFYQNLFAVIILSIQCPPPVLIEQIGQSVSAYGNVVWLAVLGFGLITQVASLSLYMKGMSLIEPAFVGLTYTLDPVTASILGLVFFGQVLSGTQFIGIAIILSAIAWLQWRERQEEKAAQAPVANEV